jgi:hypothetical protein
MIQLPCSTSTTGPATPTATLSLSPAPVVPQAACYLTEIWFSGFPIIYQATIFTNDWITDGGADLESQEGGCGILTAWSAQEVNLPSPDETWIASYKFTFNLPAAISGGCIERAIASAGGPTISCINDQDPDIF